MTKAQVDNMFKEVYKELIEDCKKTGDKVKLRTAYNDYIDAICKNGLITDKQCCKFTCPFKWVYK